MAPLSLRPRKARVRRKTNPIFYLGENRCDQKENTGRRRGRVERMDGKELLRQSWDFDFFHSTFRRLEQGKSGTIGLEGIRAKI